MPPNAAIAFAMPASTCGFLVTSIATPRASPPTADLRRGSVGALLIEIGDHDFRALARIGQRNFLADAARRARDDGDLVFQLHACVPIRFRAT